MIGLAGGSSLVDAWHEVKYKSAAIDSSAAGQKGSRNLRGRDRVQVKHPAEEPGCMRRRNRPKPMRALPSAVQYIITSIFFGSSGRRKARKKSGCQGFVSSCRGGLTGAVTLHKIESGRAQCATCVRAADVP